MHEIEIFLKWSNILVIKHNLAHSHLKSLYNIYVQKYKCMHITCQEFFFKFVKVFPYIQRFFMLQKWSTTDKFCWNHWPIFPLHNLFCCWAIKFWSYSLYLKSRKYYLCHFVLLILSAFWDWSALHRLGIWVCDLF